MGLTLKIVIILVTIIVLGLWPLFNGNFIDKDIPAKYMIGQLTKNGLYFLGAAFLALVGNVALVVADHRDNNKSSNETKSALAEANISLAEIKKAMEENGLKYDSANQSIIFNQPGASIFGGIVAQGKSNLSDNVINMPPQYELNEGNLQDILGKIKFVEKQNNITNKFVHIKTVKGTKGYLFVPGVYRMLIDNGYIIHGVSEHESNEMVRKNGFGVGVNLDQLQREIVVVNLGNP